MVFKKRRAASQIQRLKKIKSDTENASKQGKKHPGNGKYIYICMY